MARHVDPQQDRDFHRAADVQSPREPSKGPLLHSMAMAKPSQCVVRSLSLPQGMRCSRQKPVSQEMALSHSASSRMCCEPFTGHASLFKIETVNPPSHWCA